MKEITTYSIEIATGLFLLYVFIFTLLNKKISVDITHLIYTIEEKLGKNWMWITTAVYTICAVLFSISAFNQSKWYLTVSLFVCAFFFFLVGVFPDVRKNNKTENTIHVGGAMLAIGFGLIYSLLSCSWFLAVAFLLFMVGLRKGLIKIKHTTYWVELFAFLVITISALRKNEKN